MAQIIFENENYILAIKQPGILSEESGKKNIITELKNQTGRQIYPLHRLDKDAGGLMIFALKPYSAAVLSKLIAEGKMTKKYYAVCEGDPGEKGTMEDFLFFDRKNVKSYVVKKERKSAKMAKLKFLRLDKRDNLSLVETELETGRTHQIRCQFSSRKTPLYGDRRYGAKTGNSLALFSHEIIFTDPFTGRQEDFTADIPKLYPWNLFI